MSDQNQHGDGGGRARGAIVTAVVLLPAMLLMGWFAWQWHAAAGMRSGATVAGAAGTPGATAGAPAVGYAQPVAHNDEDAYLALRPAMRRAVAERMAGTGEAGESVEVDLGPRGTMTRLPPAHHPVTVGRVVNGKVVVGEVMQLPEGAPDAAGSPAARR